MVWTAAGAISLRFWGFDDRHNVAANRHRSCSGSNGISINSAMSITVMVYINIRGYCSIRNWISVVSTTLILWYQQFHNWLVLISGKLPDQLHLSEPFRKISDSVPIMKTPVFLHVRTAAVRMYARHEYVPRGKLVGRAVIPIRISGAHRSAQIDSEGPCREMFRPRGTGFRSDPVRGGGYFRYLTRLPSVTDTASR